MKTALQQHIDWLEATLEIAEEHTLMLTNVLKLCINDAKSRLETEKEQLRDAWDTAHQAGRFEGKGIAEDDWQTFEEYHIETFN